MLTCNLRNSVMGGPRGPSERRRDRLQNGVGRAPDSQPVHQTAQRVRMKMEDGSGPIWPADHPPGSGEHSQNVLTLYFFERISGFCFGHRPKVAALFG